MEVGIYLDGDQLSTEAIERAIHQYMHMTMERDLESTYKLFVAHNGNSKRKSTLLAKYKSYGVVLVVVPTRKQAADFVLVAQIQKQITMAKTKGRQCKVALASTDKLLIEGVSFNCVRELVPFISVDPDHLTKAMTKLFHH